VSRFPRGLLGALSVMLVALQAGGRFVRADDCNTNGVDDIDEFTPIFEAYTETPDITFPDFVETTDSITVNASSSTDMDDLDVDLLVTHPFMGDTEYSLESPMLINITIMDHRGGSTDNCDILFDDSADGPPGGTMIGTFTPAEPLAAFPLDVANRTGDWVIHCLDTFGGSGTGTLNQWSLHFAHFGAPDCNTNLILDECDVVGATSDADSDLAASSGELMTLDAGNAVGRYCSLAFDPAGRATISYYTEASDDLRVWHDDDGDFASDDCQPNLVPDECETDCNTNGFADDCDVEAGTSTDCRQRPAA